jgi:hypothetical protein
MATIVFIYLFYLLFLHQRVVFYALFTIYALQRGS